jgi:hypothetical protein
MINTRAEFVHGPSRISARYKSRLGVIIGVYVLSVMMPVISEPRNFDPGTAGLMLFPGDKTEAAPAAVVYARSSRVLIYLRLVLKHATTKNSNGA